MEMTDETDFLLSQLKTVQEKGAESIREVLGPHFTELQSQMLHDEVSLKSIL